MTAHQQNAPTVAMRLYAATLGLAIAALVSGLAPAYASNLLGGTMSWVPDPGAPNTAIFTITVVHRRDDPDLVIVQNPDADGRPGVGTVYHDNSKVKNFTFGDFTLGSSNPSSLLSADINFIGI